jgi:hypothetical protein
MSADHSFDQKITICIDEILDTLGLNGKQALLTHLERNAGLRKDTILEDPDLFRKNLGLVLGEHSAEVFEGWIVKRLVSSFKLKQASNLTLAKTICMIRTAEKEPCENYKEASRDHYVDTNRCKNIRDQYRIKDTPRIRRSSRESDPHAGGRSKE